MSKKDEEMTTPKSSQIMGIKVQSEFEHPPKLQQELVRCASSVCGSTMMTQANVRSDSAPGAAPSVEVAEDPGVNLFPVREGQCCPLVNIYKRFPRKAPPVITFINIRGIHKVVLIVNRLLNGAH